MKIASKFGPSCPSCRRKLPKATFHAGYDMPWPCLGCGLPICVLCYVHHTADAHPSLNAEPCAECGGTGDSQPHAVLGHQDDSCPACSNPPASPGA